jgi:glutathione S-transferase
VAAEYGTIERYLLINTINYIASELQTAYSPLFSGLTGEAKTAQVKSIYAKFEYIHNHILKGNDFLVDNKFSVADALLYVLLSVSGYAGVQLSEYPVIQEYCTRIGELPCVKEAQKKMKENARST